MLTIKSMKGAEIMLMSDEAGFVSASAAGKTFCGTHPTYGVMIFGSHQGEYLQLADGVVSIISASDVASAKAFCAKARVKADAAEHAAAVADHAYKMATDSDYAADHHHNSLSANMDRANSDN